MSGGGCYVLGDRGSAALYGRSAVALAVALGPRHTPPSLSDAVARAYGTTDITEISRLIYASPSPSADLGRLAPQVVSNAEKGRQWAITIVQEEVAALAAVAERHINDTDLQAGEVRVALVGGVWRSDLLCARFADSLARLIPSATLAVRRPTVAPVAGEGVRIVSELTGTSDDTSARLLESSGWDVRAAVEGRKHGGRSNAHPYARTRDREEFL